MESGYFRFKGDSFKQLIVTAMGGRLSCNVAGIFMNFILNKLIDEGKFKRILLVKLTYILLLRKMRLCLSCIF